VYHQWHHNFGVTVDWWDHVFGTYKEMPWDRPPNPVHWRDLLDIEWRKQKSKVTQQRVQNAPDSQA
jgi:hypothetical protein